MRYVSALILVFSLSACLESRPFPNYLEQARQANAQRQQEISERVDKYRLRIQPLQEACDSQYSANRTARANCIGSAELRTANEIGLPGSLRNLIAEQASLRIKFAKEVDAGRLTQDEASTQFLIEVERVKARMAAERRAKNQQQLSRLRDRVSPVRETTCRRVGDSLRCSTWP